MKNMKSETCNVCGRNVLGKAELCTFCRRPFERTKNKYPDANYEDLILLTRQFISEQKARQKAKRDSNGQNMRKL